MSAARPVLVSLVFGVVLFGVPKAEAETPKGAVYTLDPLVGSIAVVSMAGVATLIDREKALWDGESPCEGSGVGPGPDGVCDIDSLWEAERWITENRSKSARLASDVLLTALALAPYAVDGADVSLSDVSEPGLRFGEEALVALQVQASTLLVTNILKLIVRRPRPLTYQPANRMDERFEGDSRLSFPSGHASFAFASASVMLRTAIQRHRDAPFTWVVGGAGYLTAAFVAYLRVAGGKHFVTDVLAGAAIGTTIGLLLPLLYGRDAGGRDRPVASGEGGLVPALGFSGRF